MRNNEFKSAREYIEYQYEKWFDFRDLSSFPDDVVRKLESICG